MNSLYIGLMSGTSLDGVDAVLADFTPADGAPLHVLSHAHRPFDPALATELLALNTSGADELHRAALAGNALARCYAQVTADVLRASATPAFHVRAIGAHGQTVRHRPLEFDTTGYTIQLNNPALLAELSGIDVVADFRSRDLAAGGQGAPLVPAFHRAAFWHEGRTLAMLNLGGIANLTVVDEAGHTIGFDCGPANALMDHWCRHHTGRPYDADGVWAASGTPIDTLLQVLQSEPFFAWPAPKSTGRDLFNPAWLESRLQSAGALSALPQDVQATLTELTAATCAEAIQRSASAARELLVCGGGTYNRHLMSRLAARLPTLQVQPSDAHGLPPHEVEACAFAWLAKAHVDRACSSLPTATGARGPRILGALYPGT